MKYILYVLFILISISCSRGYFNTVPSYYNYEEAYNLVHSLKNGTLIVLIPCNKKKATILKAIYEKETDKEKKSKLKNDYNLYINKLHRNQKSLINGVKKYYDYSNFVFIPDTLIKEFKQGQRENIFLKSDFTFESNVTIDTLETILMMRGFRDNDDLHIYKLDGSVPPKPFPFASTVPTGEINLSPAEEIKESTENRAIHKAAFIINARLYNFYKHNKPPN